MRLIFSRRRTIGSLLIRFFTWSRWSHVSIVESEDLVIDATLRHGVRRSSLHDLINKASNWIEIDVPLPDEDAAMTFARREIGKGYDWTALVGHLFRSGSWASPDSWFCSELVAAAQRKGGLSRFRVDASRITPEHLWMVL